MYTRPQVSPACIWHPSLPLSPAEIHAAARCQPLKPVAPVKEKP